MDVLNIGRSDPFPVVVGTTLELLAARIHRGSRMGFSSPAIFIFFLTMRSVIIERGSHIFWNGSKYFKVENSRKINR